MEVIPLQNVLKFHGCDRTGPRRALRSPFGGWVWVPQRSKNSFDFHHDRQNTSNPRIILVKWYFPRCKESNCQLAATRNIKAIRPLLDRVLVSRIKAETVPLRDRVRLIVENVKRDIYPRKGGGEVIGGDCSCCWCRRI